MEKQLDMFVNRVNNFYFANTENLKNLKTNIGLLVSLSLARKGAIDCITKDTNKQEVLMIILKEVYRFLVADNADYKIFDEGLDFHKDVFEACAFASIAIYLNSSKRCKRKSIKKFIRQASSPLGFEDYEEDEDDEDKYAYVDKKSSSTNSGKYCEHIDLVPFRKMRNRVLSSKLVYPEPVEWSAMSVDAMYEWSLYFRIANSNEKIRDTYKRLGNLNNDVRGVIKLQSDNKDYRDKANRAYKRYISKLKKIDYAAYTEMIELICLHITENKKYYGHNVYRLEKSLRPFITLREIESLLSCENEGGEKYALKKTGILNSLFFPNVYKMFFELKSVEATALVTLLFNSLLKEMVFASLLVLDTFVETEENGIDKVRKGTITNGYFGENWESVLIDTLNGMTEDVFYDPSKIAYPISSSAHESFVKIMSAPVNDWFSRIF